MMIVCFKMIVCVTIYFSSYSFFFFFCVCVCVNDSSYHCHIFILPHHYCDSYILAFSKYPKIPLYLFYIILIFCNI
jgi:hypothetical protein